MILFSHVWSSHWTVWSDGSQSIIQRTQDPKFWVSDTKMDQLLFIVMERLVQKKKISKSSFSFPLEWDSQLLTFGVTFLYFGLRWLSEGAFKYKTYWCSNEKRNTKIDILKILRTISILMNLQNDVDKEHLGRVTYVPPNGIDGKYYPYSFVDNYHQPIVGLI